MKNKILSFALPLLLALSPVAAPAARLLWVDVRGSATVEDGDTNPTVGEYRSSGTGHSVNAFRVSVPDANASGGTNRLVFAYEENGSMVVGGSEPVVRSLDFADGGALWAPLDLAAYADRNLVVTMELGYVDPANDSSFEKLAFATEHLGSLLDAPHVSIQSDLNPPALTPWAPETFTVTVPWAIAYDLAGGTNNAANPEFYTEGQLPIALLPAGREGYTFAGWTNELGVVVEEIAAGSTGDRSFGATWLENVEPPAGASFIYDGTAKTGVPSGTGYSVAGDATATEPGQYTVTLSLQSGYIWSDGTTADKTVTWSIAPAVAMTLSVPDETTGVVTTNYFATLQEAIDATASSDPVATNVVLRGDVEETVVVTNSVAIDLAGHELDGDVTNAVPAVIGTSVPGGGITGDIVSEGDSARLAIEGGEFDGGLSAPDGGAISITGGHFAKDPSDYVADGYYAAGDDTNGYDVLPCRSILDTTITVAAAEYTGVSQVPAVAVETNGVALVLGTDFTVAYETNALVNADTYAIVVNGIGAWKDSFPTNFVITAKSVTITVADATKVYGEDDPAFTGAVVGLVDENDLGTVAYSRTGSDEDVGTYAGVLTASYTANANYTVTVVPADFTIKPAAMTISVAGYEGVYDGASHDATATTQPAGATVTWSTDGGATWSADVPAILNAGTNEVIAQAVLANYATVTSEVAKLIVTPKEATITVEASEKVYGENDPAFTGTVEGLVADGDLGAVTYSRTNADVNDVGTYADVLTASYTANANYAVTVVPADFTIKPAAMTISVAGYEGVYDGASHDATATTQPAGATVTWSTDGGATWSADVPAILNAGTNEVIAQAVLANYATVTSEVAKLIVTPKPATITVEASEKVYGENDPAFTGTVEGLVADGDLGAVTYSRTNADVNDVGTYADVLTASYTANANYAVTVVPADFTIKPAAMTITVAGYEGVYDGASHDATATTQPAGATVTWSTDGGATWSADVPTILNAGTNEVIAQAVLANYATVTSEVAKLIVTPKPATITVEASEKVYGENDPAFTGTVEGLVADGDLGSVAYSRTNADVNDVGTYADVLTASYTANANYAVTVVPADFTIKPAAMTISVAGYEGVYDGASHDATATTQPAGATVTWSTDGGATWSDTAPAILNAGTNEVIAQAVLANYATVTSEVAKLIVTPKPATITVEASEKVYGENDPAFTGTVEGLVADGDLGSVAYSRTNADVNDVGTYADVLTASYTANANYAVTVVPADFTIKPAAMTITVAGYEGVYDGASHDATATTQPAGATVTWSTDGGATWSADVPTILNAGTNEVIAQAVLANYATVTSEVAKLVVTPKPATITVEASEKVYGENDPAFTGAVEGLVADGDLGSVAYSRTNADVNDVGTYADVLTASYTANANYAVTVVPADFTIKPAAMTITVAGYEGVYDGASHDATATTQPAGATVTWSTDGGATWSADVPAILNAGTNEVIAQAVLANYATVTSEVAKLIVTPKPATITVEASEKVYGENDPAFTGTVEGLVADGDLGSVAYSRTNADVNDVGTYADVLTASYTANANYAVTVVPADFTIKPAAMTITVAGYEGVYDGASHDATATTQPAGATVTWSTDGGATWSADVPAILNAGTNEVIAQAVLANYATVTSEVAKLIVTPKPATITVEASEKVYGENDPAFTGTVEGLVADGDLGSVAYSRTNADVNDVGTYADVLTASYTANANYAVTVVPADFTIKPAAMTITVAGYEGVYDGASHDATATTQPAGATVTWSTDGGATWSADVPTILNAGTNEVIAQAVLANYATVTSEVAKLIVTPKEVTIAVASSSKTFGTEDPAFTGTVEGLVADGDLGEITYSRTNADEDVGTYAGVLTASYTANANYSVTVVPGDFEITAAAAMVITVADGGVATTNYYATLAGAITNAPADATVQLLADVAEPAVDIDTPITLDLNGKTWTLAGDDSEPPVTNAVAIAAKVEIVDRSENGGGAIATDDDEAFYVGPGGDLTLVSGAIEGYVIATNGGAIAIAGGSVVSAQADGTGSSVTMTGGTATGAIGGNWYTPGVWIRHNATGTITTNAVVNIVSADSNGHDGTLLSISGGTINGKIDGTPLTISVTGGFFTEDPTDYVAQGYYAATVTGGYEVLPQKSILGTTITVADGSVYDGTGKEPMVTVTTNGVAIAATDGYTLSWANNTNAGENASVTITGTGAWKDSATVTFTIAKKALGLAWSNTSLVYTGEPQAPTAEATGIVAGDDVSVVVSGAQTQPGTYTATASLSGAEAGNYALPDPATTEFTITAVYVAQVGTEKFFAIADAIAAAGGLVAEPEVITLLTNADASVTLTAPSQRLRVALDGHELTVLSGDPVRYEVAQTADASEAGVTVYALEQLKADGLMIVRFDYEAAKLAYDMGTAENMLRMYPTNQPIWCTIATATDLAAPLWTTVESSRAWKENLVPLADATDADLAWLENLDTTSSPVRFWRIAVTPFALTPNEEVGFKPAKPAGE